MLKACKMYVRNIQDACINTTSEIHYIIESIELNTDELIKAV